MAKKIIQVIGTSSGAGKSFVTMALCRVFSDAGFKVAPFKAVNMSLNSIALSDGSEISRAQWLQAMASREKPRKEMNPILLKPEKDGCLLVANGKSISSMGHGEYSEFLKTQGRSLVSDSICKLLDSHDVIVCEGAGSPAEINMDNDLANAFAIEEHGAEALLVGDIERGGVFAALYGTLKLMKHPEAVKGLLINKMHGEKALLGRGIAELENITERKVIGVMPFVEGVYLPGEDSEDYKKEFRMDYRIAVIKYPHVENYGDIDPIFASGGGVNYISDDNAEDISRAKVIIMPGSKEVVADLEFVIGSGIGERIKDAASRGSVVVGICGGYQMLGRRIDDPYGIESDRSALGLGLLNAQTVYLREKVVREVSYRVDNRFIHGSESSDGYEIHYGRIESREEPLCGSGGDIGSISENGRIIGTNIHGILENRDLSDYIMRISGIRISEKHSLEQNICRMTSIFSSNVDLGPLGF